MRNKLKSGFPNIGNKKLRGHKEYTFACGCCFMYNYKMEREAQIKEKEVREYIEGDVV